MGRSGRDQLTCPSILHSGQDGWPRIAYSFAFLSGKPSYCAYASNIIFVYSLVLDVISPRPGHAKGIDDQVVSNSTSTPKSSATAKTSFESLSYGHKSSSRAIQTSFSSSTLISAWRAPSLSLILAASEPRRVYRRPFGLSYAAMAGASSMAWYRSSASAGGMLPMGSRRRRLLNQSTHSSVANSTASKLRHGPRRWMTSAL